MKSDNIAIRKIRLLAKYNEIQCAKKKDEFFRSLSLSDRNLIRQGIIPSKNALF